MKVCDLSGIHIVADAPGLARLMRVRTAGGVNEFLLSREFNDYPLLSVLVKDDLAAIHYIPGDGEAGFASVGKDVGLNLDQMTTFSTGSPKQTIEISNRSILQFSVAFAAAAEFLKSQELPNSIEWQRL